MKWFATLFACILITLPAFAQEPATDKAATEQADSESQAAQTQTSESAAPPKAKRVAQKETPKDADDYHASEEISEDLSVSYPVDI
ncbi:hypothetical protein [Microbulbifer hainanensis]|uniref:hypothetical protein n=1 Tax=Microbulbifer hainanensis TaxID=2735675 RepID=UPI001867BC08|nr:hypothetical protein [Microbulbifer hainanensis]